MAENLVNSKKLADFKMEGNMCCDADIGGERGSTKRPLKEARRPFLRARMEVCCDAVIME